MSVSRPQTTSSNQAMTTTDSYNSTNTVNRVFDNVGNTQVYLNTPEAGKVAASGLDNKSLLIIAGITLGGLLIIKKA